MHQLGPYTIGDELGRGGMGTVYSAVDENSGERVAVKVLSHGNARDAHFRARFATEIESLKKLKHERIVELLGYGEQEGVLYYAMQFVDGSSLADELRGGRRYEWREVVGIGRDICEALRHAHDRGVIHRDLKPANLLCDGDRRVMLTDFGIAKLFGGSNLTADGGVLGTVDHMSPEQAEGRPATTRSDLYSLGSVLYTLLARRTPFASPSVADMIHRLKFESATVVDHYAPDIPPDLVAIIHKLLEKDPAERIGTALAVANRLGEIDLGPRLHVDASSTKPDQQASGETPAEGRTVRYRRTEHQQTPEHDAVTIDAPTFGRDGEVDGTGKTIAEQPDAPHPADHFTTVESAKPRLIGDDDETSGSWPTLWLKLGALGATVALGAVLVWLVMRPESADALYDRISAGNDSTTRLVRIESDIDRFLAVHADDPRHEEVLALKQRIELDRWERKIRQRSRDADEEVFAPAVGIYLEAIALEKTHPDLSVQKIQAMLALFNEAPTSNNDTAMSLRSARRLLPQLILDAERHINRQRGVLNRQLSRADKLQPSKPEQARGIWKSIVELYSDKAWAAEAVQRANDALQREADVNDR